MTLRLSDEARRYIGAFEEITDVPARDCVLEEREPRSGSDGSSGQRGGSTASKGTGAERSSASSRTGEARETTAEPSPSPREDGDQPRDVAWAEEAIETAHVATVPGSAFGTPGWVRLAYANSEDRLREGVERLAEHDLL